MSVFVGGVEAVAGSKALVIGNQFAICRFDFELDAREGLARHAVGLADQEAALGGIRDNHCLRVPVGADDHVLAGFVHDIACRGLDLRQHISAGGEIGNANLAVAVRGEQPILRQGAAADHAVQPHFTASGRCNAELRAGERLAGDAVPLLHNQLSGGLVLESQGNGTPFFNLDRLRLRVDQKSGGGLRLGDDHTLAGLQAGNADFAVLVCAVNSV